MQKEEIRKTFFQIEQAKRRRVQVFLKEIGLTPGQGQARILQSLATHKPMTQRELAQECDLDVTTMSRALDRLESEGYLERRQNPQCRRSYQIVLTEAGEQKAELIRQNFAKLEERMCGHLSEEEAEILLTVLKKIERQLR